MTSRLSLAWGGLIQGLDVLLGEHGDTNSFPTRRAGSPVQVSARPSTANLTPA